VEPELKVIDREGPAKLEKVTSSETYLKPKRDRSKNQIEWSRELGKISREFKLKKKEKNYEITAVEEVPVVPEVPEVKEVNKYYLSPYLVVGVLTVMGGGGVYYFYKLKKNVKPSVGQIYAAAPIKINLLNYYASKFTWCHPLLSFPLYIKYILGFLINISIFSFDRLVYLSGK
jgi:hypothetical protein